LCLFTNISRRLPQIPRTETRDEFRALKNDTIPEYARELVRMLFNCIQQATGAVDTEYYPTTPTQTQHLLHLHRALITPDFSFRDTTPILHQTLFSFLTQEKIHGGVEWPKLSVVSFLIARSMGETEWIRTSEIGRVVAKLIWAIRGTVLYEIEAVMATEQKGTTE
jgi:hypothetical protein